MELSNLIEQSGLTLGDFAVALGIQRNSLSRMLSGAIETPQGVVSDAYQVLADLEYVESIVRCNPHLQTISYKIWKKVLDTVRSPMV